MIRLEHMRKTYDRFTTHPNHVLNDVSLTFPDTGFVCILGPSGCGKTTLLNVIGGLDKYDKGRITVDKVSAKRYGTRAMEQERNRRFGYIFQNYYLLMERSVTHNVYLGLHAVKMSRKEKLKRVKAALEAVEMLPFSRKNVKDLSGGQQQRVAIARALVREPDVIFADEPTGNLDEINTDNICNLLRELSKDHLVVMVTHEERIAEEYADRVIKLDQGKIAEDITKAKAEEGAAKAERASSPEAKGAEEDGAKAQAAVTEANETAAQTLSVNTQLPKQGRDPVFKHVLTEVKNLLTAKGKRTVALKACLVLLTAMLVLTTGDYMTIAEVDPEEFIMTDSHVVQVEVLREGFANTAFGDFIDIVKQYMNHVGEADAEISFMPVFTSIVNYNYDSFLQMDTLSETFTGFSVVGINHLDESTLIHGRMPERADEVVVDRWILDAFMDNGGMLGASIGDVTHFLGQQLTLAQKKIDLTIVGICDSKEPSIYLDKFMQYSVSAGTVRAMTLDELKAMYPGKYDDVVLGEGEILASQAVGQRYRPGSYYQVSSYLQYMITELVEDEIYADIVVNESEYDTLLMDSISRMRKFLVYTDNKEEVKEQMAELPQNLSSIIQVEISDPHTTAMESYMEAARARVSARMIVTVTIMLITVVMLFIMQKARMDERKEMLGVYRLLGISKGRSLLIFTLETLCQSVTSALPAAVVTWGVITALTMMPELAFGMVLPWQAALAAYGIALLIHLLASLRPAVKFLNMPPAVLAGMYDF